MASAALPGVHARPEPREKPHGPIGRRRQRGPPARAAGAGHRRGPQAQATGEGHRRRPPAAFGAAAVRVHDGDAEVGDEELREDLVERLLVMLLRVPRLKEGGQQAGGGGLQAGGVGLQAGRAARGGVVGAW